jgi:biotin carboxyl carrier protein
MTLAAPPISPSTLADLAGSPGVAQRSDADLARRALVLQAAVLAHATMKPAATAFATELAAGFGCARVTLGFVRRGVIELVATSHGRGDALVGAGFDAIAAAMDESVQQGASVHLPAQPGARSVIRIAHLRQLQRQGGAIASVPLLHAGDVVGAVSCEWAAVPAALADEVDRIETLVNLIGPVLNLMRLREAPWHERARGVVRRGLQRLRDLHDRRVQVLLAAGVLGLAALCVVPAPYRVGGHARVEGLLQRSVVAPADGYLKTVHVRPGDHVTQGQVLVEMADQDLQLQRRKWASELGQHESAHALALARADRSALVVALARADQARAQLAMVDADIARARIVAPLDGVVIQGDLAQAIGSPVERGKPLLVIAPSAAYRVVVEVDERDIGQVQAGQPGSLALGALPWDTLPIAVSRVTPIARSVDGHNVFEVEAELSGPARTDAATHIRPGLEGVAKLTVDQRPLAWAWSHRLVDWVRLKAWAWWA